MATVKDPVCGMEIDKALAKSRVTYLGETYYFCSEECKKTFKATPHEVVRSASTPAANASSEPGT